MNKECKKDSCIHYRRYAREWVMQFLFQNDLTEPEKDNDPVKLFAFQLSETELFELPEKKIFKRSYKDALKLLTGVLDKRNEIDELLSKFAVKSKWTLERMDTVDRNIMRVSIYEMLYCPNVPLIVSIDEAVEIGKKYGSGHSPAFINGILNSIKDTVSRPSREQFVSDENAD
jgi:transcription antitermination factor NusB